MDSEFMSKVMEEAGARGLGRKTRSFTRRSEARTAGRGPAESMRARRERVLGEIDSFLAVLDGVIPKTTLSK